METGEDKEVGDATRDARRDAYRIQAKARKGPVGYGVWAMFMGMSH